MTQNNEKAPEQGWEKELTPIGELIKFIDDNYEPEENKAADLIRQDATSLLEAERKMVIDCYEQVYGDGYRINGRTGSNFFNTKYRQHSPTPNNNSYEK